MFLDFLSNLFGKPNLETVLEKTEKQFAAKEFSKVVDNIDKFLDGEDLDSMTQTTGLGRLLMFKGKSHLYLGQQAEAVAALLSAQQFFDTYFPDEAVEIQTIQLGLAECYINAKKYAESIRILEPLVEGELVKQNPIVLIKIYPLLGSAYQNMKQYEKTIETNDKLLSFYKQRFPTNYLQFEEFNQKDKFNAMLRVAWEAKKNKYTGAYGGPFLTYTAENGGGGMMDIMTAQFIVSELNDPNQADLDKLKAKTTKISAFKLKPGEKTEFGTIMNDTLIAELTDGQQRDVLDSLDMVVEDDYGHRMSMGDVTFKFYEGNKEIGKLKHLGGGKVRWDDNWQGDAQLIKAQQFEQIVKEINAIDKA